jgi:probable HAF family extracellular repeat protein
LILLFVTILAAATFREHELIAVQSRGAPTLEAIDGPQAKATIASAINRHGEIVGRYTDQQDRVHAFLIDRTGTFRTLDFPGAMLTIARGLNDSGDVVGRFDTAGGVGHGYIYRNEKYMQLDFPGPEGTETFPWSINASRAIVGRFTLPGGDGPHGFLYSEGKWTRIDHPESKISAANGINGSGEIVGIWFDAQRNEHSFRLREGRFSSIDVPNAQRTLVDAILESGTVSGTFRDSGGVSRAYIMDRSGCVTTIDTEQYPGVTVARGLNMVGAVVGQYVDRLGRQRGYLFRWYPLRTC